VRSFQPASTAASLPQTVDTDSKPERKHWLNATNLHACPMVEPPGLIVLDFPRLAKRVVRKAGVRLQAVCLALTFIGFDIIRCVAVLLCYLLFLVARLSDH
jgi:hypothetical protein